MARRIGLPFLAGLLLSIWPQAAWAQDMSKWDAPVANASARFGIPEDWIRRVIQAESGGRTTLKGRPIRSRAGAMGLMQLMPGTWRAMRTKHRLGLDPDDPNDNILAGTAYLRALYDQFGYPGLFAAYNAGPGRYAAYLARGRRLPAETVAYVARIAGREMLGVSVQASAGPRRLSGEVPAATALTDEWVPGAADPAEPTIRRIFFPLAQGQR